ncbi:PREDICTED: DPH3 homolog [Charadrius vociferus]|uniref:DPH3 homolog n=1 Tax=Charadrius vociferus TaxID=50402 RepID=UPI0005219FBD|nr:PREDICTED: DPH3 homolog [Charadrius vociferus]
MVRSFKTAYANRAMTDKDKLTCTLFKIRQKYPSLTKRRNRFIVSEEDLENGEDVATCPSCSLILRVIYDQEQFMRDEVIAEPLTNKELIKC